MEHTNHDCRHIAQGADRQVEIDLDSLTVTRASYRPGLHIPTHFHELPSLTLVIRGGFEEQTDRECLRVGPLDLLVKPAGAVHADTIDEHEGVTSIHLVVDQDGVTPHGPVLSLLSEPRIVRNSRIARLAREVDLELAEADDVTPVAVHGLALQLLAEAARGARGPTAQAPPQWLRIVLERLDDDSKTAPSLGDLAQLAGVHPAHLARVFRRQHGCSIGAYIRRRRIERAAAMIRGSECTLAEVAARCGFYDQSHFSNSFRRWFGVTPRAYCAYVRTRSH